MTGQHAASLEQYGWTQERQQAWEQLRFDGLQPARVIADFGTSLKLAMPDIATAELSGKLAHYTDREKTPKVGDWVAVKVTDSAMVVEEMFNRTNEIARKVAGRQAKKQIIGANVDIAFILVSLDSDFSVERLNRFLYQLSVSGVEPVIVLNKADKTDQLDSYTSQLLQLKVPVVVTIASEGVGIDEIARRIPSGKTAMLLGSSGVGKSTLTNRLLGREAQATAAVRESDDTGKHTTVHRELFVLPGGGLLIDTPGIRELQLWGSEEDLESKYADIATLEAGCKYKNCRHTTEEGCKITEALRGGELDRGHYANYLKMKRELIVLAERNAEKARQSKLGAKRRWQNKLRERYDELREYE